MPSWRLTKSKYLSKIFIDDSYDQLIPVYVHERAIIAKARQTTALCLFVVSQVCMFEMNRFQRQFEIRTGLSKNRNDEKIESKRSPALQCLFDERYKILVLD